MRSMSLSHPARNRPPGRRGAAPFNVRSAHDFVWARVRTPYDLVVYQMGNAWCHDYMWPYLFKWPGLVVLHDAHLHHARAWSLLRRLREADYRAELAFNHPALSPDAAEIGLSGFSGPLYYFWPMLKTVVTSARAVAVHNPRLAADLAAEFPGTPVRAIPMGVADPTASDEAAQAVRRRHGFGADDVVLSAFGGITPEKRIEPILQALAVARRYQSRVRLLLVGQAMPHFDALAAARALGVDDVVTIAGLRRRRRSCRRIWRPATSCCRCAGPARARRRPRGCAPSPPAGRPSSPTWRSRPICRRSIRDRGRWSTRSRRWPRVNRSPSASISWTKRTR